MPRQNGFSLIELLVVLAIAGLMTGLSVALLDGGRAGVDQALQRLAAATREQSALARHAGQLRGLRWDGKRPEFVLREGARWVIVPARLGDWPPGLRPDWSASDTPQLLFTPDGWARAGRVQWRGEEGGQRWAWTRDGQLRVDNLP